jgi:hypothetical protein
VNTHNPPPEDLRLQGTGSKTGNYQSEKSDEKRARGGLLPTNAQLAVFQKDAPTETCANEACKSLPRMLVHYSQTQVTRTVAGPTSLCSSTCKTRGTAGRSASRTRQVGLWGWKNGGRSGGLELGAWAPGSLW